MQAYFVLLLSIITFNYSYAQLAGLDPLFEEQISQQLEPRLELSNMPRIRTADTVGMCQSFAPAVLLDYARCVDLNNSNCKNLGPDQEASTLDLNRMGDHRFPDHTPQYKYSGVRVSGSGIGADGQQKGFGGDHILARALADKSYAPESCAPFSQLVNKSTSYQENMRLHEGVWNSLKKSYEKYQELKKTCSSCADQFAVTAVDSINEDFDLKIENSLILKAFSAEMYDLFLERLLIPARCKQIENRVMMGNWDFKSFPALGVRASFESTVQKIKEVIRDKKAPLMLPVCLDSGIGKDFKFTNGSCKYGHDIVVNGYRKVKDKKGKIRHLVKVQNNWGKKWQDDNNQGWVDAESLLFRTGYETNSLVWLEQDTSNPFED